MLFGYLYYQVFQIYIFSQVVGFFQIWQFLDAFFAEFRNVQSGNSFHNLAFFITFWLLLWSSISLLHFQPNYGIFPKLAFCLISGDFWNVQSGNTFQLTARFNSFLFKINQFGWSGRSFCQHWHQLSNFYGLSRYRFISQKCCGKTPWCHIW